MLRKACVVLFGLCLLSAPAFAAKVEGVHFPDTMKIGGQQLVFNGGGQRLDYGFGVYVAGLYLQQKSADAAKIVNAKAPMDVRIQITSFMVTADNMASGFEKAFEETATTDTAPIKAQIEAFCASFKGLGNHDVYDFAYVPGKGVQVLRNGTSVTVIPGIAFKEALYGIWLGPKSVQSGLKERMLGK